MLSLADDGFLGCSRRGLGILGGGRGDALRINAFIHAASRIIFSEWPASGDLVGCSKFAAGARLMCRARAYVWAIGLFSIGAMFGVGCSQAAADTLDWALVQAYQNNPSLSAQRAALRVIDENVPQAVSGYRPKVSVTAVGGYNNESAAQQFSRTLTPKAVSHASHSSRGSVGLTGTQTLFNGFQTANQTRQAEKQVDGARETLRVTEQQVLLDAATAYMNVLRDRAILELNRSNVEVLTQQLKQTRVSVQRRRGDAYRRRPVLRKITTSCRALRAVGRTIELSHLAGKLPSGDRSKSGKACGGNAG